MNGSGMRNVYEHTSLLGFWVLSLASRPASGRLLDRTRQTNGSRVLDQEGDDAGRSFSEGHGRGEKASKVCAIMIPIYFYYLYFFTYFLHHSFSLYLHHLDFA